MPTRARTIVAVLVAVALTIASCSSSTDGPQGTAQSPSATTTPRPPDVPVAMTPVLASVVAAPVPVPATDGKTHLAYELQLTNTLTQEVTMTSVAVHAGDQTLLTLAGDKLGYWTRVVRDPHADNEIGTGPGRRSSGSTSYWTSPPPPPLTSYTRSASRSRSPRRR